MRAFPFVLILSLAACGGEASGGKAAQVVVAGAAIAVGSVAPAFELPGSDGRSHALSDYAGQHVVLAFFPKAFTGG